MFFITIPNIIIYLIHYSNYFIAMTGAKWAMRKPIVLAIESLLGVAYDEQVMGQHNHKYVVINEFLYI